MPVGFEAACREISFNDICPHLKDSLCATTQPDEVQVDLLNSSGCTLVFKACEVLVELTFGKPSSLMLPSYLLGLVMAEAALVRTNLSASIPNSELIKWLFLKTGGTEFGFAAM
ncbi:hypothetical protein N9A79_00085 [Pirellulales bacterium]|nr:hypothetical protein [Pirellulales bacterium]